jgi:predicted DNA binding CopG/RHH family protein
MMGKKIDEMEMAVMDDSQEEREIVEAYEKGELIPVENQEEMRKKLRDAARATVARTKHISIRISEKDLRKIKARAVESGIPYQTLVGSLLHQYADGKIALTI